MCQIFDWCLAVEFRPCPGTDKVWHDCSTPSHAALRKLSEDHMVLDDTVDFAATAHGDARLRATKM